MCAGRQGLRWHRADHAPAGLLRRAALLATLSLTACLGCAGPALAGTNELHAFDRTIASAGSKCAFSEPGAVAMSRTGETYVIDRATNRLERFSAEHKSTREEECLTSKKIGVAETSEATNEGLAVDNSGAGFSNGDVWVWAPEEKALQRFVPEAGKLALSVHGKFKKFKNLEGETVEFESEVYGLATDASGDLWMYTSEGSIYEFSGGELPQLIGFFETNVGTCAPEPGFAVAPHGEFLYVGRERENAIEECDAEAPSLVRVNKEGAPVGPKGEELTFGFESQLDWDGVTGARVDPHSGDIYFDNGTSITEFTGEGGFVQRFAQSGEGALKQGQGIGVDTANGEIAAADLDSEFNGIVNLYKEQTQTNTPPGTGPGHELPDGRRWEQVSPQNKLGAQIYPISRDDGIVQASTDGDAITYTSAAPLVEDTPETQSPGPNQVMSRLSATGWQTESIAVPRNVAEGEPEHPTGVPVESGNEYRVFTEDLSTAYLQTNGFAAHQFEPKLAPEATETTLYKSSLAPPRAGCQTPPSTCYRALVYPHSEGGEAIAASPFGGKLWFYTATPDGRYAVFRSEVKLTAAATSEDGLYEWSEEGGLKYISALPEGEASPFAEGEGEPSLGAPGERQGSTMRDAISANGRLLAWSLAGAEESSGALYVTDTGLGQTVRVDAQHGVAPLEETPPQARFQAASADGRHIFFTDAVPLTTDATTLGIATTELVDAESLGDLYECDVAESGGHLSCELHDLTAETHGEWAGVQGVLGADEAGTMVYFVANASLAGHAGHGDCAAVDVTTKETGELEEADGKRPTTYCTLYVSRFNGSSWTPEAIATLSGQDRWDWWAEVTYALGKMTSRVSADGRYAAFMSDQSLTGYDNIDVNEETGRHADEEVFRYDAQADRLTCVSCNASGARPKGALDPLPGAFKNGYAPFEDYPLTWSGRWLAASIPGWTAIDRNTTIHQSRVLANDGRTFFNADDSLVPADENGVTDVYEYEPNAVGSCASANGCVSLLSSGSAPQEAAFLDASENGDNVFLITNAQLAVGDGDDVSDVYDVHACSEGSPCASGAPAPHVPCKDEECKSPAGTIPAPPSAPPSSALGPGNSSRTIVIPPPPPPTPEVNNKKLLEKALKACRRAHKRKGPRKACERKAHKRYRVAAAARHDRATHARRHAR